MRIVILDDGIATFYRREAASLPGNKPEWTEKIFHQGMYKNLSHGILPAKPTDGRVNTEINGKIRIWQNRRLNIHDKVVLSGNVNISFEIVNIYHGIDDDGEEISDISLKAVSE